MNRSARRATAGKPTARIEALEAENQQLRDYLFAIVKHQGRVRVPLKTLAGLSPDDSVNPRKVGEDVVFEYVQSTMVVPKGVTNGAQNA